MKRRNLYIFMIAFCISSMFCEEDQFLTSIEEIKQSYLNGDSPDKTERLIQGLLHSVRLVYVNSDENNIINVKDFISEYKLNQITAEQKYFGKTIILTGFIGELNIQVDPKINEGISYREVSSMELYSYPSNNSEAMVKCFFTNVDKSELQNIEIGSMINIKGVVSKSYFDYIEFIDCRIEE